MFVISHADLLLKFISSSRFTYKPLFSHITSKVDQSLSSSADISSYAQLPVAMCLLFIVFSVIDLLSNAS